jgi:hypothetical protein
MARLPRLTPDIWTVVIVLALAIIGVLLIYPLYNIFLASFLDNETAEFTTANYAQILGRNYYRTALYNSIMVGFGGMVGAVLLGVPLAFFTTRFAIKGRSVITTLAILALVSPPFIGAYAWITMLGSNGWLRHWLEALGVAPGVRPQILSLRIPADGGGLGHGKPFLGRGRGELGVQALGSVHADHLAHGISCGERRRLARLRALSGRLRHAVDHRAPVPGAVDPGLQSLYQRDRRQPGPGLHGEHDTHTDFSHLRVRAAAYDQPT